VVPQRGCHRQVIEQRGSGVLGGASAATAKRLATLLIATRASTGVSAEQTACRSAPPDCSVPVHISVSRCSSRSESPISRSQFRVALTLVDANLSNSLSCRFRAMVQS
jgi:hypothetical protein